MTDKTPEEIARQKLILEVSAEAVKKRKEVYDQREEIMTAFIAKYNCEPDDMVQVEWRKSHSEMLWFVVRKQDCIYCEKCREKIAEGQPSQKQKEKQNGND